MTITDPDLHLVVAGRRIDPDVGASNDYHFHVAAPIADFRIVSRSSILRDMGLGADSRRLGFQIHEIRIDHGGVVRKIPLDSPMLCYGFYEFEQSAFRWTDGDAYLPAPIWLRQPGPATISLIGFGLAAYVAGTQDADRALMSRFESLGSNCELGFVQEHYGVDSPSLFRWAGTTIDKLVHGLRNRFDGLGDPAFTLLEWRDADREYWLRDERYLSAHTHKGERLPNASAEQDLLHRSCARWRLMKRKLFMDISRGEKILVYSAESDRCDDAACAALYSALAAIGPARLLVVRSSAERSGVLERVSDRFAVGYLERFVGSAGPYTGWLSLCANAVALFEAQG